MGESMKVVGGGSGLGGKPKTRLQNLLAKIAGDPSAAIKAKSKNEIYLSKIGDDAQPASKGNPFTKDNKEKILAAFRQVVWLDDDLGASAYAALVESFYPLSSISAIYTQSGTVYDADSLSSLKADLVVTAHYDGEDTAIIPSADYELSGTLEVGTSIITVSYKDKTTTFDVTVTESVVNYGYETVGEPTISDGIMTPTETGWVRSNIAFLPDNRPWKIITKIKNKSNSGYNNYLSTSGVLLQRVSNQANAILYLTKTSIGDISNNKNREFTLNTWMWCKVEFTGSSYLYGTSTDGVTYNNITINSSEIVKQSGKLVFGPKASNTSTVNAQFDLNATEVWINGKLWWKAIQ